MSDRVLGGLDISARPALVDMLTLGKQNLLAIRGDTSKQ